MKQLEAPDTHYLEAAQGWLWLGNHLEANGELEKISPILQTHPDVLEIRWGVYATAKRWEICLDIAEALIEEAPERPFGWIHRSQTLRQLKRVREAYDSLLPALDKFPNHSVICYNLARYACKLGRFEDSRTWSEKAFALGNREELKQMALADPDLEMIWTGF
ncbi:MAG: hypothetical protein JWQ71_4447 [Pedosphaera sp.]|nr:hypothetical protein [Pedosphaera sp.]